MAKTANQSYIRNDGSVAFTADQSMGGNRITSLGDPVNDTDAVNLKTAKEIVAQAKSLHCIKATFKAYHHIEKFQFVFVNPEGSICAASSLNPGISERTVGMALNQADEGGLVDVVVCGIVTGMENLEPGKYYFLNQTGYATRDPEAGLVSQLVGNAIDETTFLVYIRQSVTMA